MKSLRVETRVNAQPMTLACVSGLQLDVVVTSARVAAVKHTARIELRPGGCGAHVARVADAEGVRCYVIGAQANHLAAWTAQELLQLGAVPLIVPKAGSGAAVSVALPTGAPGLQQLFVQRLALRPADLTPAALAVLAGAEVVIMGPMAPVDNGLIALHRLVASTAKYAALLPHPDLIASARFAEVASWFDYVQFNHEEACVLDRGVADLLRLALRLRWLLRGQTECCLTAGRRRGWLWAATGNGWHWVPLVPTATLAVNDLGPGYAFAAKYLIERRLRHAPADQAVVAACECARRWVAGLPLA